MNRSQMLALTAAAAGAPAAAAAQSEGPVIRCASVGVEEGMLTMYAAQQGFFKAAGLNVAFQPFSGGGAVTQAVVGGTIDVGVTNSGSLASAHAHGVDVYMLACGGVYSPAEPIAHLAVNKTLGIKTAKDLAGKTLAVTTLRDMVQASVLAWIDGNGGDSKAVNFTEITSVEMPAAILARRIDGAAIVEPIFSSAKNDVLDLGLPYSAVAGGKPFQTLGVVCNKDWADKNPALAKRVAAVIHDTAKWANNPKNRNAVDAMLAAATKIDPAVIASYPRVVFAESNSAALVQPVIDLMVRYGILPQRFPAGELFAPGVL
ncbi:MAG: ABC transporter substrate-binding protein [Candidatus Lustribacter sp.]|jgi:NitT/TauT family transport system substrate-binding protein